MFTSRSFRFEPKLSFSVFVFLVGAVLSFGSVASAHSNIHVENAWIRAATEGSDSVVVYMTLTNHGAKEDALIGVTSSIAKASEMRSYIQDGPLWTQQSVSEVKIPAKGAATFAPGSSYVRLKDLQHLPKLGEQVSLTLKFQRSGNVKHKVTVRDQPMGHSHSHGEGHDHGSHSH